MNSYLLLMLVVLKVFVACYGVCLIGETDDCVFQCHCLDTDQCSQTSCPGGCQQDGPFGHWKGPACQIGNMSPGKLTNQSGALTRVTHKGKAIDGRIDEYITCEQIDTLGLGPAAWWIDLGGMHKIFSIEIYFTTYLCCGLERINSEFKLSVRNNSESVAGEVICEMYNSTKVTEYTNATCPTPIGRYVHFSRLPGSYEEHKADICEVVVIGHRYINCSACPAGVDCNDVIGCQKCLGKYQPDCKEACRPGYYGINCASSCGRCQGGLTCDIISGVCTTGCEKWWATDKCDLEIKLLEASPDDVFLYVWNTTSTTVTLKFYQPTVSRNIVSFYHYQIQVSRAVDGDNRTIIHSAHHLPEAANSTNTYTVEELLPHTLYNFEVQPYIDWDGSSKEYGVKYGVTTQALTECAEPLQPVVESTRALALGDNVTKTQQDEIEITYKPNRQQSFCENITKITVEYKLQGADEFVVREQSLDDVVFNIKPQYGGTYVIQIRVQNADGMQSVSEQQIINVRGPEVPTSLYNLKVIIPCVVAVLGLILLIVIIVVACKRCEEKKKKKERRPDRPVRSGPDRPVRSGPDRPARSGGWRIPRPDRIDMNEYTGNYYS